MNNFLLGLFIALPLYASDQCHVFHLRGKVVLEKKRISVVIRKGTNSEKVFILSNFDQEAKMAPYLSTAFKGEFILSAEDPKNGSKILGILSTGHTYLDPLDATSDFKRIKSIACPKP